MMLTHKQQALLDFIRRHIAQTGKAPSLRHAAQTFGVSHAAIVQLMKALEEKGTLRREGRYSRTVYLLNSQGEHQASQRAREIPLVGRIAAGRPLYAQEEWNGSVLVDGALFGGSHLFALTVKGDSMIQAGILPGDVVICEPRQFAQNGEIVVALVREEEATVKRFYQRRGKIELRAANPRYAPLHYTLGEVLIQGKVIGLMRGPSQMARR